MSHAFRAAVMIAAAASALSGMAGERLYAQGADPNAAPNPTGLPKIINTLPGAPEGVGVDDAGNVYAGWTAKMAIRRYVK